MTIIEYSAERIGQEWTAENHAELVRVVGRIEDTARAVVALNQAPVAQETV